MMKQLSAATPAQPRTFSQGRRRAPAGVDLERRSSISRASLERPTNGDGHYFELASGVGIVPLSSTPSMRRTKMKWTKPAFKALELASEVTAYRYTR